MNNYLKKRHKYTDRSILESVLFIRNVENALLDLFKAGTIGGTVHTSVGQEFSAVCCTEHLKDGDIIFSNHRCHGHFLAHGGDAMALVGELMGKENGVCKGVGGSQHLYTKNFYTNGIQGSIVPVAAGMALSEKLKKINNIAMVFIGDGTLGQGVVYETINLCKLKEIPLVIVCENNGISQTTLHSENFHGIVELRIRGFGIDYFKGSTKNPIDLSKIVECAISKARNESTPVFIEIITERINAHSKGDDTRSDQLINSAMSNDLISIWIENNDYGAADLNNASLAEVNKLIDKVKNLDRTKFKYTKGVVDWLVNTTNWVSEIDAEFEGTVSKRINDFFLKHMAPGGKILFIGEDVISPYGGAFKIAKDLSTLYNDEVISTPISEQCIAGLANGLALGGHKPYLEFMFGDFACLAADQIVNSAAKFFHMYAEKVYCPVVFRMPMAGGRGYGPTHSQSLEKLFCGIENTAVVSINRIMDPLRIYEKINEIPHPVIVIENKKDYAKDCLKLSNEYNITLSESVFPIVILRPRFENDNSVLIATYGGSIEVALEVANQIFINYELSASIMVFSLISPVLLSNGILNIFSESSRLITIEEGSGRYGFGAELISTLCDNNITIKAMRMASKPYPIPANLDLEKEVLVSYKNYETRIKDFLNV